MPRVKDAGRRKSTARQQEAGEVADGDLLAHIDRREDHVPDEGQHHAEGEVAAAFAEVVGRPTDSEQDDGTDAVWGDGVEVGFEG